MRKYLNGEFETITLCGSTKFEQSFKIVEKWFTDTSRIILTPTIYHNEKQKANLSEEECKRFCDMHKQRILMSDSILVINANGYIGEATKGEIYFAKRAGKNIYYLEEIK